jgi:hypothetical protein
MPTLAEKVQETALAALPDWQVAAILNAPDSSLPEILELVPRMIGPGTIMNELGAAAGAAALDALEALAAQVPHVKWAMILMKGGGLDVGSAVVREQIDGLVPAQIITQAQADQLKALGEKRRFPSWAEHNEIEVTARTVGLARGAI